MNFYINNINNLRNKGPTYISGEIIQDSSHNAKLNINNINKINNQNGNNDNNNNVNKKINNNINSNNLTPVYNPQNLKIDSNNAGLNINAEQNKNKENPKKNIDISEKNENNNLNKLNNEDNIINNNQLNQINNKAKENKHDKHEESHKGKERSSSQGIVNPLHRNSREKEKEEKEVKEVKENQQKQTKIQKEKEKEQKKEKEIPINEIKITKKIIKDILPYTHVGFDGEEPKENNQDNYFIFKNFADHKDYIYMSVCDGHGVEGHFVSEFIKEVLPYYMSENLKDRNILTEKEITHQIITETFIIVNNMLVSNESINSLFSGSTCVSVIFTPERLIVPNIGDSRAVLARFDKETGKYKAIELSRDHKPTEKDEAKRIYENDGRIQPFTEDGEFVGPQRVWIKEEEVPGLAMTRSFGDRVAATVGVMSEPEIKEFDFDENDKYMIIASDGIWEFISSQECIDIIQKYYESNDMKGCCDYLYQESSKRWLKEEEVIDDTTLILVFFE